MTEIITPSSIWQGTRAPSSRWTVEQLRKLAAEGVAEPERVATATITRTPRVNAENWTLPPQPVPYVLPRLAVTRTGRRAKVVTPAGAAVWLDVVHHG